VPLLIALVVGYLKAVCESMGGQLAARALAAQGPFWISRG
jgi:hypothetical protein